MLWHNSRLSASIQRKIASVAMYIYFLRGALIIMRMISIFLLRLLLLAVECEAIGFRSLRKAAFCLWTKIEIVPMTSMPF